MEIEFVARASGLRMMLVRWRLIGATVAILYLIACGAADPAERAEQGVIDAADLPTTLAEIVDAGWDLGGLDQTSIDQLEGELGQLDANLVLPEKCPAGKLGWQPIDNLHGLVSQGFYEPNRGTFALIQTAPTEGLCDMGSDATTCSYGLVAVDLAGEITLSKPLITPPIMVPGAMWPTPTGPAVAGYQTSWKKQQTYFTQFDWSGTPLAVTATITADGGGFISAGTFFSTKNASVVAVTSAKGASVLLISQAATVASAATFLPDVVVHGLFQWDASSVLAVGISEIGPGHAWVARLGVDLQPQWQLQIGTATEPFLNAFILSDGRAAIMADTCVIGFMPPHRCLAIVDKLGAVEWRGTPLGIYQRSVVALDNGDFFAVATGLDGEMWRIKTDLTTRWQRELLGVDTGSSGAFLVTKGGIAGQWQGGLLAISTGAADKIGHPVRVARMDRWGNLDCGVGDKCFDVSFDQCAKIDDCNGTYCDTAAQGTACTPFARMGENCTNTDGKSGMCAYFGACVAE